MSRQEHIPRSRADVRGLRSSIVGDRGDVRSLAGDAVSSLELEILQKGCPVGESLGSLQDVQKALGLGRPALRETITVLEARGLLQTRRGPGGGLFVAAPTPEDVIGALLMHLTISNASADCVTEFRLLTWRVICDVARETHTPADPLVDSSDLGFAVDLATRIGKPALVLIGTIAEMLVRACGGRKAPAVDKILDEARRADDAAGVRSRLKELSSDNIELKAPIIALEAAEHGLFWTGRKSAMVVAARLTRELALGSAPVEAEWQTAERLGFTEQAVRQARRILQDFGVVLCHQGRKGAVWTPPTDPGGIVRLLAPCFVASGVSSGDNIEVAAHLVTLAPELAATKQASRDVVKVLLQDIKPQSLTETEMFDAENMLLKLGGNPLLEIMVRTLGLANIFSEDMPTVWADKVDMLSFNTRILEAIVQGDAASARSIARAKSDAMNAAAKKSKSLM